MGDNRIGGVNIAVIVAAWARGWTLERIGFAAGVTRERIRQRLEKYEQKNGPVERFKRAMYLNRPTRAWTCAGCGKTDWAPVAALKGHEEHFCSMKCYAATRREVTDAQVEEAIDMRWAGRSWGSVAAHIGHCTQTVQTRIWKHLYVIGMLDMATVESIWDPQRGGHHHAWNWLERNTGLVCTEDGVRLAKPVYKHSNKSPWGKRLVRTSDEILQAGPKSKFGRDARRRLYLSQANSRNARKNATARGAEGADVSDRSGATPIDASAVRGTAAVDQTSAEGSPLAREH